MSSIEELEGLSAGNVEQIAAAVIEPLVQGAAGMKLWPKGTLAALRTCCDRSGTLLIKDEVLTGFGRTGKMFAFEHEATMPDILVLGKALTDGYIPLALTVVSEQLFRAFSEFGGAKNTLSHAHSFTGNALACAAAKASLELFEDDNVLERLAPKIKVMRDELAELEAIPSVREARHADLSPPSNWAERIQISERRSASRHAKGVC